MATLEENLKNMRVYFKSGKTKEASWRKSQLKGLRRFLLEKEEDIFKALMQDLGKHRIEAFRDEVYMFYFSTEDEVYVIFIIISYAIYILLLKYFCFVKNLYLFLYICRRKSKYYLSHYQDYQ